MRKPPDLHSRMVNRSNPSPRLLLLVAHDNVELAVFHRVPCEADCACRDDRDAVVTAIPSSVRDDR
jgi:hypothetical protein